MDTELKVLTGLDLFNYFEKNPEIQTRYLLNVTYTNKKFGEIVSYSLAGVLSGAFAWSNTVEGHEYWSKIRDELKELD